MLTPFENIVGKKDIMIENKKGETFKDLVDKLINKYGEKFKKTIMDEKNRIKDSTMVLKNGVNISAKEDSGFKEKLNDEEEYVFCSVISGG